MTSPAQDISLQEKDFYYRNLPLIRKKVLADASKDGHVIYGSTAVNAQVPGYLNKKAGDVDAFVVGSPMAEAMQMEAKLDKAFGGNFFVAKKAKHPGTWKVKSRVTGETVVDYSNAKMPVPTVKVHGNVYAKRKWIKEAIKKNLNNVGASFRRDKDLEAFQRIKIAEANFLYGD